MKELKIGITGGTGVLGRLLIKELKKEGYDTSVLNKDICIQKNIREWIISEGPFNIIFHLAAIVPTIDVIKDPIKAYQVNVGGTINLVEEIERQSSSTWFFYASTSHVYREKKRPIRENDAIEPITLYGKTKRMAEEFCEEIEGMSRNRLIYCCGRIFSFYHETQKKPFLYPVMKERLNKEKKEKSFYVQGAENVRDFLNAKDVATIIRKLMENKAAGVFNIASGNGIKIKDFVQCLSDRKLNIISDKKYKKNILVANIDKMNKVINR